jgi:hypothetical protein
MTVARKPELIRKAIVISLNGGGVLSLTDRTRKELCEKYNESWKYIYSQIQWLARNKYILRIKGIAGPAFVKANLSDIQEKLLESV